MEKLDWEIPVLRIFFDQKRELFFFDILKPENKVALIKFTMF